MVSPAVAAYLERLPDGIRSYPQAQLKGSVIRWGLARMPKGASVRVGLPEVDRLLADPPPVNTWVQETYWNAFMSAVYEDIFEKAGGAPAFTKWVYEGNRDFFRSPLYRVLFLVVSPERMFIGAEKRWSAFRRGTTLELIEGGQGHALVRVKHPPFLMNEIAHVALAAALRAVAEAAGAKDVLSMSREASPTEMRFEMRWK